MSLYESPYKETKIHHNYVSRKVNNM